VYTDKITQFNFSSGLFLSKTCPNIDYIRRRRSVCDRWSSCEICHVRPVWLSKDKTDKSNLFKSAH